jgi:hypothetical protein
LRTVELALHFLDDVVIGLLGKADLRRELHPQMRRPDLGPFLRQPDIADGIDFIFQRPVRQLVGKKQGVLLAQFDIALGFGHFSARPSCVGDDEHRYTLFLLKRARRRDFRQQRVFSFFAQHIELPMRKRVGGSFAASSNGAATRRRRKTCLPAPAVPGLGRSMAVCMPANRQQTMTASGRRENPVIESIR